MTTTEDPATRLTIPARELRKGDVISMGTIASASLVTAMNDHQYMAIKFETRIGEHGTAFPLDLKVTVFSRTVPPVTLDDVVTALTELFEQWNQTADKLLDASDPESSPLLAADMLAESRTRRECSAGIHAILTRLQ